MTNKQFNAANARYEFGLEKFFDTAKVRALSSKQVKEIDLIENKKRVCGDELEAIQDAFIGVQYMVAGINRLSRIATEEEIDSVLESAQTMKVILRRIMDTLPLNQQRATLNNLAGVSLSITRAPTENTAVLTYSQISALMTKAMHYCTFECEKNEAQSRCCDCRMAYEAVPRMQEPAYWPEYDADHCPFMYRGVSEERKIIDIKQDV